MRVFRDGYGVPHLRADSVDELAFLQGRVTAADRGDQISVERRRSEGLLSEMIGPAGLGWDRFARRARIDDTARRCFANLEPRTREWLRAYAEGVRAGGVAWHPWSSLGVFLARHIMFASFPAKLWNSHVERTLGPHAVGWFTAESAASSGSNAWTVPGEIAGDPHRLIELPGVYQQVRLACPQFDVAGLTFAGVPGVQHFGHAGGVAWAVTNAMADYQDLFVEELRRTATGVEARGPHGWEPVGVHTETIPVRGGGSELVEVIETARGPMIDDTLSLRTPTRVESDLGFSALLPLLHASTVDDVAAALERWAEPVNSVLTADTTGRVVQLTVGRVPVRDERNRRVPVPAWDQTYAWQRDYLPMTRVEVTGNVVNANDRRPDTEAYGNAFASKARADRIRELIAAGVPSPRIHMDTPMPADSVEAGRRAAWRFEIARRLHEHPTLKPLMQPHGFDPIFDGWTEPRAKIGGYLDGVLAGLGLTAEGVAGPDPVESGTWGSRHRLEPVRLPGLTAAIPRTELGGERDSVLCLSSIPGVTDLCSRGPVARYVWDIADRQRSRWIVPFGASGDPASPHFADQLPLWASGELIPLVTDWSELIEEPLV
ncbi:penicillin acylase family protein [Actinoplanes sp. LDG1-06]|uniref:Penicillin acylase family protein n=1 Tax=Paractinoplanes ovalisporus TaxID=2810368 RepID=A0ABS2ATH5_9ACTN|nr:penicillin acylase family protein [Actinoplanes ovalisporus]MBM2623173.1 penicillin acylase family protein [Actinoplanes ovalisporus]